MNNDNLDRQIGVMCRAAGTANALRRDLEFHARHLAGTSPNGESRHRLNPYRVEMELHRMRLRTLSTQLDELAELLAQEEEGT